MARRTVADTSLEVLDTGPVGDAPTVCFSHGLLFSHKLFAPQVEALRQRYRVVAWDHRGQGDSAVPEGRCISIERVTTDAILLLEQMQLGPVHFVGLSMGGFVGMRVAARRPDLVRSLSLLETAPDPEPRAHLAGYRRLSTIGRYLGVRRFLANRILTIMCGASTLANPAMKERVDHIRALLMSNKPSIYKAVNGVLEREGVEHELSQIRCPTLVLRAAEDQAIARDRARQLADGIPHAEWVEPEQGGHSCTLEHPDVITAELSRFLTAAG